MELMETRELEEPPGSVEEPPGSAEEPPGAWSHIAPELWNDWRWQLSHRLRGVADFARVVRLTDEEKEALAAPGHFRVAVTPYFASLMDPDDPHCPIRRQVIPTTAELTPAEWEYEDSLAEDAHSPVPGLVHRYPDRVLILVTTQCASYCRFCTRSRLVGDSHAQMGFRVYEQQLAYIAEHPQVRDVLFSGGDPLLLAPKVLQYLLSRLRAIPHVEVIRIGTRVPVFLPQRITDDLVQILRSYHPLWMNIHFNHPKEVTPAVERALAKLADAGIPLGSQTVLLAGINDCPNIITVLMHKLVRSRVRPYYLYQCDMVRGTERFRTPMQKGIEIMEALRGHTSGYAIPTFVIDAPGGGGKVPILPNYLLSMSEKRVVVRNYEGFICSYEQPGHYVSHDPNTCPYCRVRREEGTQTGVRGLLAGEGRSIEPAGWQEAHRRGSSTMEARHSIRISAHHTLEQG